MIHAHGQAEYMYTAHRCLRVCMTCASHEADTEHACTKERIHTQRSFRCSLLVSGIPLRSGLGCLCQFRNHVRGAQFACPQFAR